MVPTHNKFHHYIPHFILKTFADNFLLSTSNTEFIANTTTIFDPTASPGVQQGGGNKGKGSKGRKRAGKGGKGGRGGQGGGGGREAQGGGGSGCGDDKEGFQVEKKRTPQRITYPINIYRVADHTTELRNSKREYGEDYMYRDMTADDVMKFEKLLGNLESTSATFIRMIWSGEDLSLTRAQLADMKKFLCIMMYRGEHRRSQYYTESFDLKTLYSIKGHMYNNNIERVQDVWFDNIKWLIEKPMEDIMSEFEKAFKRPPGNPFDITGQEKTPIHILELLDFGMMAQNTVCVWEAEDGSEFILSEGCFGAFEGDKGVPFHNFFVVSPRHAIVLVNQLYMRAPGTLQSSHLRRSWFGEKLHASPQAVYVKGPIRRPFALKSDFSPNDVFKYRRIIAPKEDVYKVNSIFLDARTKYLTYKSSASMYKSLQYYDKVKHDTFLFTYGHDYSILKRKLFADLNRTHSP